MIKMTNKDNIKKTIMNYFDKKQNYNYILRRIGKNKMNKFNKIVVPSCVLTLTLIFGIVVFNNNSECLKDNSISDNSQKQDGVDNIIFNNGSIYNINASVDAHPVDVMDIDGMANEADLIKKFSFLNDLNIPGDYDIARMYELYVKENVDENDYNKLWQYHILFTAPNEISGAIREIEIIFTKEDYILACLLPNEDTFLKSTISGKEISLYKTETSKEIEAFFDYDGYKFFVQSTNLTRDEFITLVKSIIQ
ncbi:MAG: hypothetical protein J6D28_03625 [Bacilli bacterium]|nr:hypothetical protein [Bacilli bacterium]